MADKPAPPPPSQLPPPPPPPPQGASQTVNFQAPNASRMAVMGKVGGSRRMTMDHAPEAKSKN